MRTTRAVRGLAIGASAVLFARVAHAADPPPTTLALADGDGAAASLVQESPPPLDIPYLQYGVSLTTELVLSAGRMCADGTHCILGSGGGVAIRMGRRSAGPWYFGGVYDLTKQNPNSLYRFATLQQLRGEARWYLPTGRDVQPFGTLGAGIASYGNEWGIDTFGPAASLGLGVESQLSRRTVVSVALTYRALVLKSFVDTSGALHDASVASLMSLELSLEERDPIDPRKAGGL